MERWDDYIDRVAGALRAMAVTDRHGAELPQAEAFARWVAMTRAADERGRSLYFIGNGGSAGMASHMATDACKNGRLRALALNDPTWITAAANDLAYDQVFALGLERLAAAGDLLVAVSSSGNSPNIVKGLEVARVKGLDTVTLSAMRPDNRARSLGDLNFYVPVGRYGWAETAHQAILHHWFDQYLNVHGQGAL